MDLKLQLLDSFPARGSDGKDYVTIKPEDAEITQLLIDNNIPYYLMTFAEVHDAHVYVVHLSCEEALANARRAKRVKLRSERGASVAKMIMMEPSA